MPVGAHTATALLTVLQASRSYKLMVSNRNHARTDMVLGIAIIKGHTPGTALRRHDTGRGYALAPRATFETSISVARNEQLNSFA